MNIKFTIGKVDWMTSGSSVFFPAICVKGATYRCPVTFSPGMLTIAADGRQLDRPVAILYDANAWANEILMVQSL
jgi:hypothetical protein